MINFIKTRNVKDPNRANATDAGIDFFIPDDLCPATLTVEPGKSINIPSGIKMIIPRKHAGIFKNKSSIGAKGLILGPCVVDSDYRGEIQILLWNISRESITLKPGQKITQMLLQKVELDSFLRITDETFARHTTERGEGGFGSTGA